MKTFTRILLAVIISVSATYTVRAQATWNYTVTNPAISDTIDMTSGTTLIGNAADDIVYTITMPFDFYVYSSYYPVNTNFFMNSDGVLRFDGYISAAARLPIIPSSDVAYGQFLSWGGNTDGRTTKPLVAKLSGSAPFRVYTLRFAFRTAQSTPNYPNAYTATIQVSFFETTNEIRLTYYDNSGSTYPANYTGINAGDGTFANNLGLFPSAPVNYLFTPGATVSVASPQSFTASAATSTQINLNWVKNVANDDVIIAWNSTNNFANPVNNTSYAVGSQIQPGMGTVLYSGPLSAFSHIERVPGTAYYYRIWSKNSGNIYSSGLNANVTTPAVPNPQSFTAVSVSSTQINLDWLKNIYNDDVIIAWNTTNTFAQPTNGNTYIVGNQIQTGQGTVLYVGSASNFNHLSLNPNTQYFYKVWSIATGNYYSSGVEANAVTSSVENPVSFTATEAGPTQINLAWVKNAANNDVIVAWNTSNSFGTPSGNYNVGNEIAPGQGTVLYIGPLTSFNHTNRNPGTIYYYKIWSRTGALLYSSGIEANATTLIVNPPQSFTATAAGSSQIDLGWAKNVQNNDVIIAWNTSNTFASPNQGQAYPVGSQIQPGQGTILYEGPLSNFPHTGLLASTQYFYSIWSKAPGNYYSANLTANATTSAMVVDDPQSFTANAISPASIILNWVKNSANNNVIIAVNSVNTFGTPNNSTVYVNGDPVPGGGTIIYNGSATIFNHAGLVAGTQYFYRIWSYNSGLLYSGGISANATTLSVDDPQNLTATTVSGTEIDLGWVKNLQSDDVMIVFNTVDNFATPLGGFPYIVGNQIAAGQGTVLFKGSATSFNHLGLTPSTKYYYMAFSVDGANYYSPGIKDSATTLDPGISVFPYVQDFETVTPIGGTPACAGTYNLNIDWQNVTGDQADWIPRTGATPTWNSGPSGDNTSGSGVYLYRRAAGGCNYTNAWLVSPRFNFSLVAHPVFEFYYHMYGAGMGSLGVQVSTNDGASWTNVMFINNEQHSSSTAPWTKANIDLSVYGNQSNVRIRLVGMTGNFTSDMAIDDIRVYASGPMVFSSVTSSQTDKPVYQGIANQNILQIKVDVTGDINPLLATNFSFNTNGTTTASDITNAKLWYSGNSAIFIPVSQVGAMVANPSGSFVINANQALEEGSNYFWLTYDIPSTATLGNFVDAEVTQVVIDGISRTPAVTAPPETKMIVGEVIVGTGTSADFIYPITGYVRHVVSEMIYLQSEISPTTNPGAKNILSTGFFKAQGGNFDSIQLVKVYMKHETATTMVNGMPDINTYTLVYSGSWPNNDITGWMDVMLDNPFAYNGIDNLSVLVVQEPSVWRSPYPSFRYSGTTPVKHRRNWGNPNPPTTLNTSANRPNIRFLYNLPANMVYTSSTVAQATTDDAILGNDNQEILAIQVVTTNSMNPLNVTSLTLNTTGTTNTADISAAKVYFSGTVNTFSAATATQFGSTVNNPSGTFTVTGNQVLDQGTNYFWLVYDVPITATINNFLDGQCTQIVVGGINRTPSVTNPPGNRQIKPYLLIGTQTATSFSIPMHYTANSASEFIYLQSEMGVAKDLNKIAFYKVSGANTINDIQNVKIYMKNDAGSTMTFGVYSLNDYTLVYDGAFPNNAVSGWMEVPFTGSFFYNGVQNLHVLVVKEISASIASFPFWGTQTVSPIRCRTAFSWTTPITNLSANNNLPLVRFEYGIATPMTYLTSTTTQNNTSAVLPGSVNQVIIGVEIDMEGSLSPMSISSLSFNTNGTTLPANILNAKVWYTGTDPNFSTINQFGPTLSSPSGAFMISGSRALVNGKNHFWLTYDVSSTAVVGNHLDAECTGFILNGVPRTPVVTAPTGQRTISGPLNGVYIVGTGGDYPNVVAATDALKTFGVDGPVTFRILPGTYTGQFQISAVTGVSAVNNVTYESHNGDSSSVMITYSPATTSDNYTIDFQGASHIKFSKLSVQSGGSQYGRIITMSSGTSNITFENCRLTNNSGLNTTSSALYVNDNNVNNITFTDNYIYTTSYYGVYFRAASNNMSQNFVFEGNTVLSNYYGIFFHSIADAVISENIVQNISNTFSFGIYANSGSNATITKNRINNSGSSSNYGIYLINVSNTATTSSLIANNFIYQTGGLGTTYGIYLTNCQRVNVYHNSVSTTTSNPANSRAFFTTGAAQGLIDVRNNIFAAMGGGAAIYIQNTTSPAICDYNLLYTSGSILGYVGNTSIPNLAAWRTASGKDANSLSFNPGFVSNTDLHIVLSPANNGLKGGGTPIAAVTDDIDGEPRNPTNPDIGADEIRVDRDLEMVSITEPVNQICAGNTPIKAIVKNKGLETITSFVVTWKINSAFQPAFSWNGTLLPTDTVEVTVGNFNFVSGTYLIELGTMNPNGQADQNTINDTISAVISVIGEPTAQATAGNVCEGQSYTVSGATATNYLNLNWTSNGSGTFTNNGTLIPTYTPSAADIAAGSVILTLTANGFGGCGFASDTMLLSIRPTPVVSFSGLAASYCPSSASVTLTPTPVGGTFSGPGISGNIFDPSVAGSGTHNITYSFTNAFGCSGSDMQSTSVHPSVTINVSGLAAGYCLNSPPATLSASPAGGVFSGQGMTANVFNPSAAGVGTHLITYTYTDPVTSCVFTDVDSTTVNAIPVATISNLAATYCSNDAVVTLIGSPAGGTFSGNGISGSNFNPATAAAGTNIITYTYTDAFGCSDDTTQSVTVFAVPVTSFSGLAATYCSNDPAVTLSGSPGGGTFSGNGVSGNTFNPATAGSGTHPVSYSIITADGCTATDVQNTIVNLTPLADAGPDLTVQIGTDTTITVSPSTGNYSYQWAPASMIASGINTATITTNNINVATIFSVTVTNNQGGCFSVDQVVVSPGGGALSANATASPDVICQQDTTQLFSLASGGTGSFTYQWSSNPAGFSSALPNPLVAPMVTTTYTVTVTSGVQIVTSSVIVTVNNLPAVFFSGLSSAYCADDQAASLTGIPAGGSFSGTGISGNFFDPKFAGTGQHIITYFYTTALGCSNSMTDTTNVYPLPIANAGVSQQITWNTTAVLSGSVSGGGAGTVGYSWEPAALLANANVQNPTTLQLQTSTLFILTVTNNLSGCQDTAQTWVYITGGPLSATILSQNDTICQGTSTQLTALPSGGTSPYTYQWSSSPAGFSSSSATPLVQPVLNTTYTVTVIDATNDTAISSKSIAVISVPAASISGLSPAYCDIEAPVTLSGLPSGGIFSGQGMSANIFDPVAAGIGTFNITYAFTTPEGCISQTSLPTTVNPTPIANAGPDLEPTINTDTTISVTPSGAGYSYVWAPASAIFSGINTSTILTHPISSTIIFSVTVTDILTGCFSTDQVVVTPKGGPLSASATATPDTICVGTQVQLNTFPSGGAGGYTYAWSSNPSGFSSNIANPVATPVMTTTYTVFVSSGSHNIASSVVVTVFPVPVVSITGLQTGYCIDGSSVTLTGSPSGGSFSGPGVAGNIFNPQIAGPGTHNIVYNYTSPNGCSNSASQQVSVYAPPLVTTPGSDTITNGSSANLSSSASGGSGNYSYSWQPASLLIDPNVQNPVTVTNVPATLFIVTVTDLVSGCQDTAHFWLFVSGGQLSTNVFTMDDTLCQGSSTQLMALPSGGTPPYSYAWSSIPSGFNNTISNPVVQPTFTTTYTVTVTDGADFATNSIVVTVLPLPVVNFSGLAATYCGNDPVATLTGSPAGGVFSGPGITANTFDPQLAGVGNHIIRYDYIAPNGCSGSDVRTATVNPAPFADAGSNVTINCGGAGQQIGSAAVPGLLYSWFPSTGLSDPNISNPIAAPNMTILYTLVVTDPNTSCSDEDLVLVTVFGTPTVTLSNDTSICIGGVVHLTASGGVQYQWSTGDMTNSITVSPSITTQYVVTVSDGVCATADTVTVTVGMPDVDLGQDIAIFSSQVVTLDAGPGHAEYLWSTGDTTRRIDVDTTGLGIGTFSFSVTVTDFVGCQASDTINITFVSVGIDDNDNAVSIALYPNPSEGAFEIQIKGLNDQHPDLQIFNITGQLIYSGKLTITANSSNIIDLGTLPRGVYNVRLLSTQGVYNRKLIIR